MDTPDGGKSENRDQVIKTGFKVFDLIGCLLLCLRCILDSRTASTRLRSATFP